MIEWTDGIVLIGFGLILGSFLNALSFRYKSGKTMWGRSACMTCNKELKAHDLIPVLSYLYLRGRCRMCKAKMSVQYPVVELIAALLTVLCYMVTSDPVLFTLSLAFFQILLFICIYDLRHTIIPDAFAYAASGIALIFALAKVNYSVALLDPYALIAGPLLALPIAAIWYLSRGKAMGLGDAKLFLAVGWFLGLFAGIAAFVFSFWIGAVVGVFLLLVSRGKRSRYKMKSEIPFGPFIALACALVYFASLDAFTILNIFTFV